MTTADVEAWIGLGSNVDRPEHQVRAAFTALEGLDQTRVIARSSLYASTPMGPQDQPPFINAVAGVRTGLVPHVLLRSLHAIEADAGRERDRGQHWGPRRLDLDLLVYGDQRIADSVLTVPHPGAGERPFVVLPWAEVAPAVEIPGVGRVRDCVPSSAPDVWFWSKSAS